MAHLTLLLCAIVQALIGTSRPVADAQELKCKPRPGCSFSKCDPSKTLSLGVLNEREYSIICVESQPGTQRGAVSRQEYNQLLTALQKTQEELSTLKIDIDVLKSKQQPNGYGAANLPLGGLGRATLSPTTIAWTTTQTQINNLLRPPKCGFTVDGICYFLLPSSAPSGFSYFTAKDECVKLGGTIAVIPSKKVYDTLFATLRKDRRDWGHIWIGMFYDPLTNAISVPINGYLQWAYGHPVRQQIGAIHVIVRASRLLPETRQGMINTRWDSKFESVLCQRTA